MDVFWFQNLLMDATALLAVNFFLKRGCRKGKIWLTAILLAICETLLLLICRNHGIYLMMTHFLLVPAAIFFTFGKGGKKKFLENWAVSYFMILVLGGVREWIWEQSFFSRGGVAEYGITIGIFLLILRYLARRREYGSHEYQIDLRQGEKKLHLKAYLDSGNQLRDIYTGNAVHIITEKRVLELFQEKELPVRLLPYTVLGKTDGLMRVVTIDEMILHIEGKEKKIGPAVLGIAEKGELDGQPFEVILHAGVLEE
ncbi:MAG: sigma-E processing peptidase SpoIIGA [Roseburia sp.]